MKRNSSESYVQKTFAENLRRLRNNAHKSQLNLAAETGLANNFINDIENCKKWVSAETIEKLSTALNVEPYQFFLSNSKLSKQGADRTYYYLDDFSDIITKVMDDYRHKYLADGNENPEKSTKN